MKSLIDEKIEILIPASFDIMSEEMIALKYPLENRPTIVYSDDNGAINVALNHTKTTASQELIVAYQQSLIQSFNNTYPTAEWKDNGITEINGRKVGYLELITPAIDTEVYNLLFFTDLEEKLLVCTFNCTKDNLDDWETAGKKIMNSIKIK